MDFSKMMCPTFFAKNKDMGKTHILKNLAYLQASSIATATATVIPTMGLLPEPMRPIISVR